MRWVRVAALATFPAAYVDEMALEIEVARPQAHDHADTQAGEVDQHQQRTVPGVLHVIEHSLHRRSPRMAASARPRANRSAPSLYAAPVATNAAQ